MDDRTGYQDYKDLLSAFHAHGVKYVVVGGFAVIYHSQPRYTKDLDLFIRADPANALATYAALVEYGAPLDNIGPGVDFDAAWDRRVEIVVDRVAELKANFISADGLIASKLASGRLQDLADADAIRKRRKLSDPSVKKPLGQRPASLPNSAACQRTRLVQ